SVINVAFFGTVEISHVASYVGDTVRAAFGLTTGRCLLGWVLTSFSCVSRVAPDWGPRTGRFCPAGVAKPSPVSSLVSPLISVNAFGLCWVFGEGVAPHAYFCLGTKKGYSPRHWWPTWAPEPCPPGCSGPM